jgi:hypothetical protein
LRSVSGTGTNRHRSAPGGTGEYRYRHRHWHRRIKPFPGRPLTQKKNPKFTNFASHDLILI